MSRGTRGWPWGTMGVGGTDRGRLCGVEERVSCLRYLVLGRSKFLWLHSLFAFLYFITNFLFMTHHCLGFVPKKSYKVSK